MVLKKYFLLFMVLSILGAVGYLDAAPWKAPVLIGGTPGIKYEKAIVKFGPSGLVYVVYKYRDTPKGLTEVYLNTYDGEKVGILGDRVNVSDSPAFTSYEPYVFVTPDEVVHVAWCEYPKSNKQNHYIRYRSFDGVSWSPTFTLGQVNADEIEDIRMGVDSSGNVNVVFVVWPRAVCYLISKYGDETRKVLFPEAGRSKHPDIGVEDDFIHVVWQYNAGRYTVQYAKKENKLDGNWVYSASVVSRHDCGRPRLSLDEKGFPHFLYYEEISATKRRPWYFYWNGANYVGKETALGSEYRLYHFSDFVVKNNAVAASVQYGSWKGGRIIYYNYKKAGEDWGDVQAIPGVALPVYQSIDLSDDGLVSAVAYQKSMDAIYLLVNGDIKPGGRLQAAFNNADRLFWGSDNTFDAAPCAALNPGLNIASYEWNFGDGNTITASTPTVTHSFQTYGHVVRVTLKITAQTGETGTIYKDIHVHALYSGLVTSQTARQIRTLFFNRPANEIQWTANPKNAAAGYPAITNYEIWRASVSSENYTLITEVGTDVTSFLDYQGVQSNVQYFYSIRSVDSEGHRSPFDNL